MRASKSRYVTVLDIGTSKICGLTAKISLDDQGGHQDITIIATETLPSSGIVAGVVSNLEKVEPIIVQLISKMEHKSNQRIDRVWINASTGEPKTDYQELEMTIHSYVTQDHISDLHNQVIEKMQAQQKYIMHAIPAGYEIDGVRVTQPIGMKAAKLKAQMVLVTGMLARLRNLGITVERAHVEIAGRVATPIASALGCLVETEKQNGAICIDIGDETISICAFNQNVPIFVDILKMGGSYITKDIARAFNISMQNAEMIKKEHGSCMPSINDDKETLDLPIIGGDYDVAGFENRPKSHLTQIIQPRCEEMIEIIRDRLDKLGILDPTYKVILTGGGASLQGIGQMTTKIFGIRPRIACPIFPMTLPQTISGPEYATLIGLLSYSFGTFSELPSYQLFSKLRNRKGVTGKILNWLVQNF